MKLSVIIQLPGAAGHLLLDLGPLEVLSDKIRHDHQMHTERANNEAPMPRKRLIFIRN